MSTQTYEFTNEMGEISGFGGGYEAACRQMLRQALEWWDAHPDADPQYQGFRNVFGLVADTNDDARALDKAMMANVEGGPTGAMHQAVLGHTFFIRKNGWEAYVAEMSKDVLEGSEG